MFSKMKKGLSSAMALVMLYHHSKAIVGLVERHDPAVGTLLLSVLKRAIYFECRFIGESLKPGDCWSASLALWILEDVQNQLLDFHPPEAADLAASQ